MTWITKLAWFAFSAFLGGFILFACCHIIIRLGQSRGWFSPWRAVRGEAKPPKKAKGLEAGKSHTA